MYKMKKSLTRSFSLIFLALFLLSLSFSSVAAGYSYTAISDKSLKEIFDEAKSIYESSISTYSLNSNTAPYYREETLPDGSAVTLIGYPTKYSANSDPLFNDEMEESVVYAVEEGPYDSTTTDGGQGWHFLSTIRYYSRVAESNTSFGVVEQKKMSRFSYVFEADSSDYAPSKFNIMYKGFDPFNASESSQKDITSTQLTMTNYPTTSMGWISNYSGSVAGVCYKFTVKGTFIPVDHFIIGNAWPVGD